MLKDSRCLLENYESVSGIRVYVFYKTDGGAGIETTTKQSE